MLYRFSYLDVIADGLFFNGLAADEKLTVYSMPLYAMFEWRGTVLPVRYEAIGILMKMPSETLFRVRLSKQQLLEARNAFLRFEREEELYSEPEYASLFDGISLEGLSIEDFLSFNARATSGGI